MRTYYLALPNFRAVESAHAARIRRNRIGIAFCLVGVLPWMFSYRRRTDQPKASLFPYNFLVGVCARKWLEGVWVVPSINTTESFVWIRGKHPAAYPRGRRCKRTL